jgi:GT2 family glycosyltransferase
VIDVSIVVLNWNSGDTVCDAAESALAQTGVAVELLVVDNGSTDGSLDELRQRFPTARFIELGSNTGFTGGMNAGTDAAQGEFVLWQNADLVLASDYCARAIALMRRERDVGAVGGLVQRLVEGQRTDVFDACGYTLSTLHRAAAVPNPETEQDVIGVSGSCPIFRRAALESVRAVTGYVLDPWYFTYGEDIDVMLRLHLAGWRVRYVPEIRAWHVRSGSTVPGSRFYEKPEATQVRHFKNRIATVIKTYPTGLLLRRLPVLALTEAALPFYLLLRARPRSILSWIRSWGQLLKERRRLVRDRGSIQRQAHPGAGERLQGLLR